MKKIIKIIKTTFSKTIFLDLILIFLLSFVVFFWAKDGEIINGNDTTYPLKPIEFFAQRLYQWNPSFGAGIDFSHGSAGITWHGLQALLASTSIPININQKLFLFILFNLISFSIYFFLSVLFSKSRLPRVTGTIFYLFNSYLFNLWGNIQSSNLCAYAFIPLASAFFLKSLLDRKKIIYWSVLFGLCSIVFSSIGMNPQVVLVVLLYFLMFLIFIFLDKVLKRKEILFGHLLKSAFSFFFFYLFFNVFWIIPEASAIFSKNLSLNIPSSNLLVGWLDFLSKNTGAINVFRLQGEWMWFENHNGKAYIPFASLYHSNPFLIISGFLSIFLSIIAVFKSKKSWTVFFGVILFIGLLFSMGTKPPFGYPFLFLIKYLSVVSFLRSPWYKFSLLTALSFAVLAAFFLDSFSGKKRIFIFTFIVLLQLAFSFPILTGQIFPTKNENAVLPFKYQIPDYIWQTDDYLDNDTEQGRLVVLPRQGGLDYYQWGGNSSLQMLNLLSSSKPVLNDDSWTITSDNSANRIVTSFYNCLYRSCSDQAVKILSGLNVKYLLLKNDFDYDFWGKSDSPLIVAEYLNRQKYINKKVSFGLWDIYSVDKSLRNPEIFVSDNLDIIDAEPLLLSGYFLNKENNTSVALSGKDTEKISEDIVKHLTLTDFSVGFPIQKIDNFFPVPPYVRFLPSTLLYRFIRQNEEKDILETEDNTEKVKKLVFYGQKRLLELRAKSSLSKFQKTDFEKQINNYLKNIDKAIALTDFSVPAENAKIENYQSIITYLKNSIDLILELRQKIDSDRFFDEVKIKTSNYYNNFYTYFENFVSTAFVKKFVFKIRKEGYYDLQLRQALFIENKRLNVPVSVSVNGTPINSKIENSADGTFVINHLFFKSGSNSIFVEFKENSAEDISLLLKRSGNNSNRVERLPEIKFIKIDSTRYIVNVRGATQPFLIIFSENFHINWKVLLPEGNSFSSISDINHFKVNGYGNGWIIDKTGDFDLVIEYQTQKIYRILLILTIGLSTLGIVYVFCKSIRIKKHGREN